MSEEFERLLAAGRRRWPEMAVSEVEAASRLDTALVTGNIPAGSKALADWIDSRIAMAVYEEIFGERDKT